MVDLFVRHPTFKGTIGTFIDKVLYMYAKASFEPKIFVPWKIARNFPFWGKWAQNVKFRFRYLERHIFVQNDAFDVLSVINVYTAALTVASCKNPPKLKKVVEYTFTKQLRILGAYSFYYY